MGYPRRHGATYPRLAASSRILNARARFSSDRRSWMLARRRWYSCHSFILSNRSPALYFASEARHDSAAQFASALSFERRSIRASMP